MSPHSAARRSALSRQAVSLAAVVVATPCFTGCAFEPDEAVEAVAECIATTSFLGEGHMGQASQVSLHAHEASGAPRFLPTGVNESLVLEVGIADTYYVGPGGSVRSASAERVCGTSEADFFAIDVATSREEGEGLLVVRGLDGAEDTVVIGVREPATIGLLNPPETFWQGATYSICADARSAAGEPIHAESSVSWFADGAKLSETSGACTLLQPERRGVFTVTITIGDHARTVELVSDAYPT